MAASLNTVKQTIDKRPGTGARQALLAAASELIEEVGPDGFSLREAARRAGLSPAAPAHLFTGMRGLLTAIATQGFREFGDALGAAHAETPEATIRAQCHAYLTFALARPGLFRLMWRKKILDLSDVEHLTASRRSFEVSDAVLRPGKVRPPSDDTALAPTLAVWAMVHGFTSLVIDGAFFARDDEKPEALLALLDAALDRVCLEPV